MWELTQQSVDVWLISPHQHPRHSGLTGIESDWHLGVRKRVWNHYPHVSAWQWNCQVVGYVHLLSYRFSNEERGKIPVTSGFHQYVVLSD